MTGEADRLAGRQAPPYVMQIELGKVREFARATGSSSAEYLDSETPPIPPTFLRTSAFWAPEGAELLTTDDLDVRRVLHGEQEYLFFGPPPVAGDRLTVDSRVESVTEKQGKRGGKMLVVTTVTDFADENGRVVAQGRAKLIQTEQTPA